MSNPKVSVLVLSFRHAAFLRQCLDSILAQETTFEFEIIIGDDASDDGSQEIIVEYQKKYFDKITQIFLHKTNLGDFGRSNAVIIQKAARSEYVIIIEGDDFWTNSQKLALQVDILDNHPETVICFHNALIQYDDEPKANHLLNFDQKEISTLDDLIGEDEIWFMATASVMYRNIFIHNAPDWFFKSKSGDIPTYILLAKHGNIRYINQTMSVYRKHFGGQSYSDHKQDSSFLWNRIEMYKSINKELDYRYSKKINKNIARYYLMLANSIQYGDNFFKSRYFALKALKLSSPNSTEHFKNVLQEYIIPHSLMKIYANVKGILEKIF